MKLYHKIFDYTVNHCNKYLILIIFSFSFFAANAQNQTISLASGTSLRDAFIQIERQTDLSVDYNDQLINAYVPINKGYTNAPLTDVLNSILGDINCSYVIRGKHILITPEKSQKIELRTISGMVSDNYGDPVIGATIKEKDTNNGVITDIDGRFSIEIAENNQLEISYMGYETQLLSTTNKVLFNIVMKENTKLLEEVVVIGYGTMKKKDLTGAISHVDAEKLVYERPATLQDIIRSAAPGLIVGPSSSSAKEEPEFRIRGDRSLNGGRSPLIVLNGVPFNGDLTEINPIDVESVDVLKDASSAAIFGAKSANGVVIITTKKGKGDKPTVTFDGSVGFATMGINRRDYNPSAYLDYRSDYASSSNGFENKGYYSKPTAENLKKYNLSEAEWRNYDAIGQGSTNMEDVWLQRIGLGTVERGNYFAGNTFDWYDSLWQTGLRQNYNVSLSGQTSSVNYYWSLGYQDNEGNRVGDRFKNFRTNLRMDANVTHFLEVGVNLILQSRDEGYLYVDEIGMAKNSPYSSPYNEDGSLNPYPMGQGHQVPHINSFYSFAMSSKSKPIYNVTSNFWGKVKLPFNVSYQFNFAPRYSWAMERNWSSSQSVFDTTNGYAFRQSAQSIVWTLDNIIKWDYTFAGKHQFDLTLLQSAEKYEHWSETMTGRQFTPSDLLQWHNMQSATEKNISSSDNKYTGDALMARLFYSYDTRYMFTASVRRDGYSAFGRSNPRATFPSLAVAWTFTNEEFFQWKPMSNGKLRLSWGKNGNREVGMYQALSQLRTGDGISKYAYVTESGTSYELSTLQIARMANYNLKWESTASWNVGLDFGFLNNRLNGSVEWYYMPTTDLLMDRTLPKLTGFETVLTNLGEVVNQGFELSLNSHNLDNKNLSWSTSFGISHNQNRIKHLYYTYEDILDANGNIIETKEVDDVGRGWFIGRPMGTIWDYEMIGIWQEDEAEEAAKYGQRPGDARARDINEDYRISQDDKVFLGQTDPKFRLSLRNDFVLFDNWDISFSLYSYLGHKQATTDYLNYFDFTGDYLNTPVRNYWTPENKSNSYARLKSTLPSNVYPKKIMRKDFVRLENISVGYKFPKTIAKMLYTQDIRVYGTIRNAAVFAFSKEWRKSNYWDVETGGSMPRTFTLGASITF